MGLGVGLMGDRIFHFALPKEQALALIEFGAALEPWVEAKSPLGEATCTMDEQMAQQNRPWERCAACDGSGWVEDSA